MLGIQNVRIRESLRTPCISCARLLKISTNLVFVRTKAEVERPLCFERTNKRTIRTGLFLL